MLTERKWASRKGEFPGFLELVGGCVQKDARTCRSSIRRRRELKDGC